MTKRWVVDASESALEGACDKLAGKEGVKHWDEFKQFLIPLKEQHPATYSHCMRVGIYAFYTHRPDPKPGPGWDAEAYNSEKRFAFLAGLGHDIGKQHCDVVGLLDNRPFTEQDYEAVKMHTIEGYNLLKDHFPLTALVAGMHHSFQPGGYGIDLDASWPDWADDKIKAKVMHIAKPVTFVDFFDALTTRENDKGLLTGASTRDVLLKHFPDRKPEIDFLLFMTNTE